jgi:plasmid maintenance system killer protein
MTKPSRSFRQRNLATREYLEQFALLPQDIQEAVQLTIKLFHQNPQAKSLRLHKLKPHRQGRHLEGSISIAVTMQYRAIYVPTTEGINVWYWIGTHADYDVLTGRK